MHPDLAADKELIAHILTKSNEERLVKEIHIEQAKLKDINDLLNQVFKGLKIVEEEQSAAATKAEAAAVPAQRSYKPLEPAGLLYG